MDPESARFYARLAAHYDDLFPAETAIVDFVVTAGARPGRRVLDLACGTGQYTQALLDRGVQAWGVDASADLIELAKTRTGLGDRFLLGDMRDPACYPPGPFGLVYCIGNSVAHLDSEEEVTRFLRTAAETVGGGGAAGRLVVQYVDVGAVEVGDARVLPALEAGPVRFERVYRRVSPDRVRFEGTLRGAAGTADSITNPLLATSDEMMDRCLRAAGLGDFRVWGGFRREPPGDSWVRVVEVSVPDVTRGPTVPRD